MRSADGRFLTTHSASMFQCSSTILHIGSPEPMVSWAVVAVRVTTHPVHSPEEGTYELLGTMTGTLQVGATVNEGEQVAINKLAEWVTTPVRSSSDSKVAIKRCLKPISMKLCLRFGPPPQRRESCSSPLTPRVISMLPSTAKGLDLRTGGCGPPT